MSCRGLYVFSHENKFGNSRAHELFKHIDPKLEEADNVPRQFSDYKPIVVNDANLPQGITLTRLIEG